MNEMRKLMEDIKKINQRYDDGNIDPNTGDIRTYDRNDEEYMQDIMKLTNEADEVLADKGLNPAEQLNRIAVIMQDISNITHLRSSDRPYAPIHEDEYGVPNGETYIRRYGPIKVEFDEVGSEVFSEVLLTHGHGENIFLTMKEWKIFINSVARDLEDITK